MKKYIQLFVLLVLISCFISVACQEKAINRKVREENLILIELFIE